MERSIAYVDAASGGNDSDRYSQMATFLLNFLEDYWPEDYLYMVPKHENVVATLKKIGEQNPNMKEKLDNLYDELVKTQEMYIDPSRGNLFFFWEQKYFYVRNFLLVRVLIEAGFDKDAILRILLYNEAWYIARIIEDRQLRGIANPLRMTADEVDWLDNLTHNNDETEPEDASDVE